MKHSSNTTTSYSLRFIIAIASFIALAALVIVIASMLPAIGTVGAVAANRRQLPQPNEPDEHDDTNFHIDQAQFEYLIEETLKLPNNMIGLTKDDLLKPRDKSHKQKEVPEQLPKQTTGTSRRYKSDKPNPWDAIFAKKPGFDALNQCSDLAKSAPGIAPLFSDKTAINLCNEVWQPFTMTSIEQRDLAKKLNRFLMTYPNLLNSSNRSRKYLNCARTVLTGIRDFIQEHSKTRVSSIKRLNKAIDLLQEKSESTAGLTDLFKQQDPQSQQTDDQAIVEISSLEQKPSQVEQSQACMK